VSDGGSADKTLTLLKSMARMAVVYAVVEDTAAERELAGQVVEVYTICWVVEETTYAAGPLVSHMYQVETAQLTDHTGSVYPDTTPARVQAFDTGRVPAEEVYTQAWD
jgi:hypothetical protein